MNLCVCMKIRPLSEVRQHRLYDVDGSFVFTRTSIEHVFWFVNTKFERMFVLPFIPIILIGGIEDYELYLFLRLLRIMIIFQIYHYPDML